MCVDNPWTRLQRPSLGLPPAHYNTSIHDAEDYFRLILLAAAPDCGKEMHLAFFSQGLEQAESGYLRVHRYGDAGAQGVAVT